MQRTLTLTPLPSTVNSRTRNQDIVYHCEHTLTAHPRPILMANRTVTQHSSLIQPYAATMYTPCKGQFLRMEVVPAGPIDDLVRLVPQHDRDAIGGVTDRGVVGEVCQLPLVPHSSLALEA